MTRGEAIKSLLERCPHKPTPHDKDESIRAIMRWIRRHATAEERDVLGLSDEPPLSGEYEKDQAEVAQRLFAKVKDDL